MFDLSTGVLAIGDPTLGMATVALGLPKGSYRLTTGALRRPGLFSKGPSIQTEIMVVYAVDASLLEAFESAFHRLGKSVSYNMKTMQDQHAKIEEELRSRVGFYWVGDLSGSWTESHFIFNRKKIIHAVAA